jgi:hypothetical protein
LAEWIGDRRSDKKSGIIDKLGIGLENMIIETFPWWSWDPVGDSHKKIVEEIKEFYIINKIKPREKSSQATPDEIRLARWISQRKKNKKAGKLDSELEALIRKELPWLCVE